MQLQAGYILDSVHLALTNVQFDKKKIESLLNFLCYFDLKTSFHSSSYNSLTPFLDVADNIISRGLPTYASIFIEDYFAEKFKVTSKTIDDTGSIRYLFNRAPDSINTLLYKSLHIIDSEYNERWNNDDDIYGSEEEKFFLINTLRNNLGAHVTQLIEQQRDLISIIRHSDKIQKEYEKYINGSVDNFLGQSVDFSLEFPYPINDKLGIVFEIDGSQHEDPIQRHLDSLRNDAIIKAGWAEPFRIKTTELFNTEIIFKQIKQFLNDPFFQTIKENYENPFWKTKEGKLALLFVLIPFAVARIQKSILHAIRCDVLRLNKSNWKIIVIERDVPCAKIAIDDLNVLIKQILMLEGHIKSFPEIELKTISNREFELDKSDSSDKVTSALNEEYDLLIDISLLSRKFLDLDYYNIKYKESIVIRSAYSKRSERTFHTNKLIRYKPIINNHNKNESYDENSKNSLTYLLQSLFRKNDFRPGQLDILNKTLQLESVVGLLPTGSGKSLTYQLSSLLQPGVTLIVDPIKSLMKDQYQGLVKQRIDCGVFINSSIRSAKERQLAINKMIRANVLFTFISPERLQIKEFRNALTEMFNKYSNSFSYCVIDEAHCVSEWGHDFRTSYLRLGENAKRFCKIKSDEIKHIPLIGLTATASFDVLSDVQRELALSENSTIRSETSDRPELIYKVYDLNKETQSLKSYDKQALGEYKQQALIDLLNNIHNEFEAYLNKVDNKRLLLKNFNKTNFFNSNNGYKNAGLIFCPHKTWVYGVKTVASKLSDSFSNLKVGTFMGSSNEDERDDKEEAERSEIFQDKFLNDEIDILVATKAFGMGIDKPNVRFTVHINFPGSIESYYQEAGRAGRDGRLAICYIMFAGNENEKEILESFHNNSFKGEEREKEILFELLNEISYSSETKISKLSEIFEEEYGLDLYFNLWPTDNPRRLYVNKAYGISYGYINLDDLSNTPDTKSFKYEECIEVLENVKKIIDSLNTKNQNYRDLLSEPVQKKSIPGIETQLSKIKSGEKLPPIIVGFRNDKLRQIASILGNDFTERIVLKASNYCFNPDDFIKNLEKEYWKNYHKNFKVDEHTARTIKSLFNKIRNSLDTFKAVYRLSIIGVIDDYEIDYNANTITLLNIERKSDDEYIENLHNYIKRYVAKSRADKVYQEVRSRKGKTIIQKCLGYLIDFVYSEIAKKRKQAIIEMRDSCYFGSKKDPEKFREYLALYFNSKYYPELRDKTNLGKEASFRLVIEYMEITEGKIDNLKHLRGAVIRLLVENPENYTLILLKTFALLLLENNNKDFLEEIRESFLFGFKLLKDEYNSDLRRLIKSMNKFTKVVLSFNADLNPLLTKLMDVLLLEHHYLWLKQFNKQFMVNYGRQTTS